MAIENNVKYLKTYAEAETGLLANFPDEVSFEHCIAIPACNENSECIERLQKQKFIHLTLLILVINQPPEAEEETFATNTALFNRLQTQSKLLWHRENLFLLKFGCSHILLLDRFSKGREIPKKEGVGRARKILCDLAVSLFQRSVLKSPWVYSTDADASLPENYFSAEDSQSTALVFDFEHRGKKEAAAAIAAATLQYEQAIKYYRDALAFAGSPYAFCTLGSTLAINIHAYCKARGFPPRNAAEDFYLLNKLVKLGPVKYVANICITIEARLSQRVPFGTGPAVSAILEGQNQGSAYTYYQPLIFQLLHNILCKPTALLKCAQSEELEEYFDPAETSALRAIGFQKFSTHWKKQGYSSSQFPHQFAVWFDAFKTLKFVHHLQNTLYPAIPLEEALQQFSSIKRKTHA